jgi:hypothetical protein
MVTYNPTETARLIAEARRAKRSEFIRGDSTELRRNEGWNDAVTEYAEPMAEQLEAADAEIKRLAECMEVAGLRCFMRGRPASEVADHMRMVAKSWDDEIARMTTERDAARAGIALVFKLIDRRDLELVHWESAGTETEGTISNRTCPEDDTCTCRIRRAMLELQLAGGDANAQALIDGLPRNEQ